MERNLIMYMFDLFSFIFPIFFLVFMGFFIFSIVKNIKEWSYNNKQPITPVDAVIVSKRSSVSHHHNQNNVSTSTTYYATFEFTNKERLELRVSGREYGLLAEGDRGILSFQGTRFIDFQRK